MRDHGRAMVLFGGGLARALVCGLALAGPGLAQDVAVEPAFTIWDVKLGAPISDIPDSAAATLACGTNGGPSSIALKSFADWQQCTPEASGLREVAFTYDDEKDYIARAMESESRAARPRVSGSGSSVARRVARERASGASESRTVVPETSCQSIAYAP